MSNNLLRKELVQEIKELLFSLKITLSLKNIYSAWKNLVVDSVDKLKLRKINQIGLKIKLLLLHKKVKK